MKTTDGRMINESCCWEHRNRTTCTCNLMSDVYFGWCASLSYEMMPGDWEEERKLANEGIEDYARMLREIDEE